MDDQLEARLARRAVAELDHLAKLESRIHVQQREGRPGRMERLLRQPQQHGGVLADGVEKGRAGELGGHFAENVDALGFELA